MPHLEASIRAKATALGVSEPVFLMAAAPEQFAQWADRVALADVKRSRGQLTDADLDECDRALGIPASRGKPKPFVPQPSPGWLETFAADPMLGIAKAVRAFAGAE